MPLATKPTFGRYNRTWHDRKAPDGFTVDGWRKITQGGFVRFCGSRHYHEKFSERVGLWVFVALEDCWGINVNAYPDNAWDTSTILYCTNEADWFADDRKTAAYASRKTPVRTR